MTAGKADTLARRPFPRCAFHCEPAPSALQKNNGTASKPFQHSLLQAHPAFCAGVSGILFRPAPHTKRRHAIRQACMQPACRLGRRNQGLCSLPPPEAPGRPTGGVPATFICRAGLTRTLSLLARIRRQCRLSLSDRRQTSTTVRALEGRTGLYRNLLVRPPVRQGSTFYRVLLWPRSLPVTAANSAASRSSYRSESSGGWNVTRLKKPSSEARIRFSNSVLTLTV